MHDLFTSFSQFIGERGVFAVIAGAALILVVYKMLFAVRSVSFVLDRADDNYTRLRELRKGLKKNIAIADKGMNLLHEASEETMHAYLCSHLKELLTGSSDILEQGPMINSGALMELKALLRDIEVQRKRLSLLSEQSRVQELAEKQPLFVVNAPPVDYLSQFQSALLTALADIKEKSGRALLVAATIHRLTR